MLKILFIHHGSFIGGGSSISLLNTLKWIQHNTDHQIKLWCPYRVVNDYVKENMGVECLQIPDPLKIIGKVGIGWAPWYRLKTFRFFVRELTRFPSNVLHQIRDLYREKPDIVHLNSSILITSAIAAKLLGIPVVWHVREVNLGSRFSIRKRLMGAIIRRLSTRVIAISPVEAESISIEKENKIKVVYNYIDFEDFNPDDFIPLQTRKELGIHQDAKVLITLGGSANFRKGIVQILGALRYVKSNLVLLIVGPTHRAETITGLKKIWIDIVHLTEQFMYRFHLIDSVYRYYDYRVTKALRQCTKKFDSNNIVFTGEVPSVAKYLAVSDILIFAGMTPHFPRPIYEAWALHKPVIAFNVDGIMQNIDNDIDGILVDKRNARELGRAIDGLLNNTAKAKTMGDCGYEKANERFRIENNMKKIENIYQTIAMDDCNAN